MCIRDRYIKDGLDGYCVTNYVDNETGEKNKDGTVKDCDETDGTSCCASPGCTKKRKKYKKKAERNGRILLLGISFAVWLLVFFRYSDIYVRRFGGFLLVIHNLVRNKTEQPKPIAPDDQYGFHDDPNNDDGKQINKLDHAGLWLFVSSVLLGLSIWLLVANETGDPYLKPCEPDVEEALKDGNCTTGLSKQTCADGTQKCIKCSSRRHFSTALCRCVNNKSSSTTVSYTHLTLPTICSV